jgi:hypothetical protein
VADLKELRRKNASDLMRVNSDSLSNEINENELQHEKHCQ